MQSTGEGQQNSLCKMQIGNLLCPGVSLLEQHPKTSDCGDGEQEFPHDLGVDVLWWDEKRDAYWAAASQSS